MKNITIRISLLAVLTIFTFQIYAKDTNNFLVISNKDRLEKLELGVAKLGAEREYARKLRQEQHNELQSDRNIIYPDNKITKIISDKERLEKLEQGVTKLGAERERARIIKQNTNNNLENMHNNNLSNRTIQSIENKERLERLERGVFQLGVEREQNRTQIQ